MRGIDVSVIEDTALTWFGELGYAIGHRQRIASGELPKDGISINAMKGMAYG